MKIYNRKEAIEILRTDDTQREVYGWPASHEKEETFAFVVIYDARLHNETRAKWRVALHSKKGTIPDITKFDCVDALEFSGARVAEGCTRVSDFTTIEEAIDFTISHYGIREFMDYASITDKYKRRYWNK